MNLTLEEISASLGGTLQGPGNLRVKGYSIDTRTLKPGELFFAIKGPRFDGHDFVQQALEKKAAAVVVGGPAAGVLHERPGGQRPSLQPEAGSVIRVSSTIEALQKLA